MTGKLFLLSLVAACVGLAVVAADATGGAKKKTHRIVFEVTVEGLDKWEAVLNNVENVQKAFGREKTEIEVVTHGKGLNLILATNTAQAERLKAVAATGVRFAACENTMRRMNVSRGDLMPFAVTVDSGVAEVVRKQEAGWSYIKAGS